MVLVFYYNDFDVDNCNVLDKEFVVDFPLIERALPSVDLNQ